jgi:hypothetical protein
VNVLPLTEICIRTLIQYKRFLGEYVCLCGSLLATCAEDCPSSKKSRPLQAVQHEYAVLLLLLLQAMWATWSQRS